MKYQRVDLPVLTLYSSIQDDCEGASACFRSCMIHDKIAFDPLKNTFPNKSEGVKDLTEVLGFNATIKYETH